MSVPMAIALSGQLLLGQPVMVKPSEAEKNLVQSTATGASGVAGAGAARKIYVGNLHFNISEDQLRQVNVTKVYNSLSDNPKVENSKFLVTNLCIQRLTHHHNENYFYFVFHFQTSSMILRTVFCKIDHFQRHHSIAHSFLTCEFKSYFGDWSTSANMLCIECALHEQAKHIPF